MGFLSDQVFLSENNICEYNRKRKVISDIAILTAVSSFVVFIVYYILVISSSEFFLVRWVNSASIHVLQNIASSSLFGVFYSSSIGGLFFIFMPLEILFIRFVQNNSLLLVFPVYIGGLFIAYSLNYLIGSKLSGSAKRLISPKKFYKSKSILNKYGKWAIFAFNAVPLPSQALAAILGVFNYNKTRFYVFFLAGQLVKLVGLTIIALVL